MKEPIIIPKKGAVNLLYLAGALVFTGLCLVFSFSSFSYLPSGHETLMAVLKPILFFGIFFFGLCSYYYAKRIFQDRPLLLVDETGVTDHSTAFAVGHIPWEDITSIQLTAYLNQTFISIAVKNEEAYLSQMNFLQRSAYKANLRMGFPLINISLNTSAQSPAAIFAEIEARFGHFYKANEI